MRQRENKDFFNMLNRIRVGTPTSDDIENLMSKVSSDINSKNNSKVHNAGLIFQNLLKQHDNVVCLLPLNKQVDEFNNEMTKISGIDTVDIQADDSIRGKRINSNIYKKNSTEQRYI